jgi:hypothetical protein
MEALQRCTPTPFTETIGTKTAGGVVAGRPFKVEFRTRNLHLQGRKEHG